MPPRKKTAIATDEPIVEAPAEVETVTEAAAEPEAVEAPRYKKVGDIVTIKKGGVRAVVTNDHLAPGKKQTRIECQRQDNGSVQTYWFDELA